MKTNKVDFDNMDFEDWLDIIRVQMHEESKGKPRGQAIKEMNDNAKKLAKQYGFTVLKTVAL